MVQDVACSGGGAPLCVIRDGVVVQVPLYAQSGALKHLAFAQLVPRAARPIGELAQTALELLAAGCAFDLEVSVLGLPTIVRKTQKTELLRLLPAPVRSASGKASELEAAGLLHRQLQAESLQPLR